jgi:molybdopterin-guanine dinucleotide biosynthesis adapter protein
MTARCNGALPEAGDSAMIAHMKQSVHPPIISIIGRSGVGKTTFLTKLVSELKSRGYRVAVLKHHGIKPRVLHDQVSDASSTGTTPVWAATEDTDSHEMEFDIPGKDTWRHFRAGADIVVISGRGRMAMYQRLTRELTPDELVQLLPDKVDIVLTEGYTSAGKPAIEILRSGHSLQPISGDRELLAIVSDSPVTRQIPQYALDDAEGIAALLERLFSLAAADPDIR